MLLTITFLVSLSGFGGQSVRLAWDASSDTNVVGYYLYYGPSAGVYTNRLDASNNQSITTPPLPDGPYYFTATSRNAQGVESDFANVISSNILTQAPTITSQPGSLIVSTGSNAVFSVGSSGAFVSYFWMKNGIVLGNSATVSGATSSSLTIVNASDSDSATYSVIVSNQVGVAQSSDAVLNVYNTPIIYGQPTPVAGVVGINVTFSVSASSDTPLSFQWQNNGSDIFGATESSYTISNVQTSDGGNYRCIVRNSAPDLVVSDSAQLTVYSGTTAPIVTTTWPAANTSIPNGHKYSNGAVVTIAPDVPLSGAVRDDGVITDVAVTRIVPSWAPLTFSPTLVGPDNAKVWTNVVSLVDGTNTFRIVATDSAGLTGTVLRTIFLRTTNRLTVITNGYGTTAPAGVVVFGAARNGAWLQIGRNYSITATPKSGNWFVNWTDASGTVLGTKAALTFCMTNDLSLTANFVTNGIIANHLSGSYNGLFAEENGVTTHSAGSLSSIALSTARSFTARLFVAGSAYLLSGTFNQLGHFSKTINRTPKPSVTVEMQLDFINGTKQITGTVSCPTEGWTSPLRADMAYYSATNPNPMAARYTMAIPPLTSSGSDFPIGYGYGLITNMPTGNVSMTGALADLTQISYSAPLSQNGNWPVCIDLYAHQGMLHGWVNFSNGAPAGHLAWVKPAQPPATNMLSKMFPAGVNNGVDVFGSVYRASLPAIVLPASSLELAVGAGNSATYSVVLTNNNAIVSPAHISGTVSTATGLITLSLPSSISGGGARIAHGVVLQSSNSAVGTVDGTNAAIYLH
ncbi:MAG: immunoglobulin domain-containing protein [Limisphaerales bacterium]